MVIVRWQKSITWTACSDTSPSCIVWYGYAMRPQTDATRKFIHQTMQNCVRNQLSKNKKTGETQQTWHASLYTHAYAKQNEINHTAVMQRIPILAWLSFSNYFQAIHALTKCSRTHDQPKRSAHTSNKADCVTFSAQKIPKILAAQPMVEGKWKWRINIIGTNENDGSDRRNKKKKIWKHVTSNIGNIHYSHAYKTDKIFKMYILKW